ncbi:MAG: PAS domain S-box protein [Ferruginibacter sp.]
MMTPMEEKYFTIFNEASDGIILMNDEGNLTDVNTSMCRLLGYTRQELLKMNIADLVDHDQLKIDPIAFEPIINEEHNIRERRLQKKDGSVVEMEVNIKRISDNLILAIGRDITELRMAQKRVALSESNFRSAFEYSAMGMLMVSIEGKFLKVNKKFTQITGYSEEELLMMTFFDLTHPDDIEEGLSIVRNAIEGKLTTYVVEKRYIHKNKNIVWVNVTSSIVSDAMEKALYFVTQVEDITAKKESELKFKNLLEKSLVGIYIHTAGKQFNYVNPRMTEIFGYTEQELLQNPAELVIHEEDLPIVREINRQRFENNADTTHYEVRGKRKDGTTIWLEIYGSLIMHNGEKAVIGNIQDVTERKRADAELKRINHDIGERIKELNCLYRTSELINSPGKAIEDILQELVHIIPPSYQYPEITTARITFQGRTFESRNFSASMWKQDALIKINNENAGLVEVFYNSEMPEEDEGPFLKEEKLLINSIAEIVGSAAERKNAEALIKEQAETFQAIIENTKESIYLISPEYKLIQFNSTALERMRITQGLELCVDADFRDYLFPDSADIFHSMFQDSLKGIYRSEEIRSKGLTGNYFWFQSKTSPVYDPGHKLIGIRLLTESIDDRKHAEAVLRESEEKFRSIVEQSLVGIYIIQHEKLVYVNPGFEKIFGYSKNKLINKMSFDGLVHPDDIELVRNNYDKRISKRRTKQQYIFKAIRNDGAVLHLEVIASVILYNEEPAVIGTLVDITGRIEEERKISQAVLNAQESERLQIGMELHDNVKQILAGSGLFMDIAIKRIDDKKVVSEILNNLRKYNTEAIDELRRLSHQLAPLVESDTLLEDKIAWLIRSLKINEKLSVSVHVDEFEKSLHNDTQLTFYRILQEQLSNIIKYARASAVEINIRHVDHEIHLQVRDNGNGFDISKKKEGIGLENIRRRAQMLNGKVEIISSPGKGCEVNVLIPVT